LENTDKFEIKLDERTSQLLLNRSYEMEQKDQAEQNETITEKIILGTEPDIQLGVNFSLGSLSRQPEGKYRFIRSIGFGGMKTVTEVIDRDTGRRVAMASVPDAQERHVSDLYRFVQEAIITARLEHPNIVPIHDIGIDADEAPYFTMKLLKGRTLSVLLRKLRDKEPYETNKYNEERLLFVFMRICNAMAFAHSKHVIHLDLKPDNVHIGEFGEVLVLDWGLAKYIGTTDNLANPMLKYHPAYEDEPPVIASGATLDGIARGTPGYMAPEQAAGLNSQKDRRSDIYALGAILYAMFTHHNPLPSGNVKEMLISTIKGEITPPNKVKNLPRPVPAGLEAIIMKAMQQNPDKRYQSVNELREDLFAYIGGYATTAESPGPTRKIWLFLVRNWRSLLLFITFVLLMALFGVILWLFSSGALEISFEQ
jgi:serine/threonine protein kinase